MGTCHAVLCAREAIGDAPFAVINADDYYGTSAYRVIYDASATRRIRTPTITTWWATSWARP